MADGDADARPACAPATVSQHQSSPDHVWEQLPQLARELGCTLDPDRVPPLRRYMELLAEWNQHFNLTAIDDPAEVVVKHVLDSLTVGATVDLHSVRTVIDVGTGAGLPGLVLKIAHPHLQLVLLDALNKRLRFLCRVGEDLGLQGVTTLHARAEDAASPNWPDQWVHRETYDLVTARAVARLNVLVEWLAPFARVGGTVVAMKGPQVGEEVAEADNALRTLGLEVIAVRELTLPGTDVGRSLVTMRKVRRTPNAYPRRPGTARKHPL